MVNGRPTQNKRSETQISEKQLLNSASHQIRTFGAQWPGWWVLHCGTVRPVTADQHAAVKLQDREDPLWNHMSTIPVLATPSTVKHYFSWVLFRHGICNISGFIFLLKWFVLSFRQKRLLRLCSLRLHSEMTAHFLFDFTLILPRSPVEIKNL